MLLELYEQRNVESVRSLIPDKISVTGVTLLLRSLVEEGFSIRDFSKILDSMSELFEKNSAKTEILSEARKCLMRNYLLKYSQGIKELQVFVFNAEMEHQLISQVSAELPIHPALSQQIRNLVNCQIILNTKSNQGKKIFLLVPLKIRRSIFLMLGLNSEDISVLAYEEIPDDFMVKIIPFEVHDNELSGGELSEEEGESLSEAA